MSTGIFEGADQLGANGRYTVGFEQDIVKVVFMGMFDDFVSKELCSIVEELIGKLKQQNFYMLLNLLNYEGSTPEAHVEGNRFAIWLENQHCKAKAIVLNERVKLDIVRHQQAFLNESQIPTEIFDSEAEAKAWLVSLCETPVL